MNLQDKADDLRDLQRDNVLYTIEDLLILSYFYEDNMPDDRYKKIRRKISDALAALCEIDDLMIEDIQGLEIEALKERAFR